MKLALTLPGFSPIPAPVGLKEEFVGKQGNLANVLSPMLTLAFFIAVFIAFYFLIWGALQYMMAQGKKEELAKARDRITWALVGLILVTLSFLIAKFISESFAPGHGGVPF